MEHYFFTCILIHQFFLLISHHAFSFSFSSSSSSSSSSPYSFPFILIILLYALIYAQSKLFFFRIMMNDNHYLPHVYLQYLPPPPTLIFLHPTFSSLCSSSTNPMIRLENIVFLLGSKVLYISYTRKQVIIFNSGSKGFTKWIIHKVDLLVK